MEIHKTVKVLTLFCTAFVSKPLLADHVQNKIVLDIAAIDWCPQICASGPANGYVLDTLDKVFTNSKYGIRIHFVPWSRAINMTRNGEVVALLSPAKSEAPDLIYPQFNIGTQQMCFFSRSKSKWTLNGIQSLKGRRIGIANNTSLPELEEYIRKIPEAFHIQPYSESFLVSNLRMLLRGRLDSFVFTKNTTLNKMDGLSMADEIQMSSCLTKEKIYFALSPSKKKEKLVKDIKALFDEKMSKLSHELLNKEFTYKYKIHKPF